MNYDDYKQNIVNQLNAKTGLDLEWEDFVLSNQKVVSGKTIQVTIKPSEQGAAKIKGESTFNIDRMDLSNQSYVFDWRNDAKVFDADVFLHDTTPSGQSELLSLLSSYLNIQLSIDDFEAVTIKPDLRYDVTVELKAKSSSFYYYGTLRVTLTHPWVNQVVMDVSLPGNVSVTSAIIGYGSLYVDGVYQTLPYTVPAGNHTIEIKNFGSVANGFKFLGPTRLKLLRVYNGSYTQLFKDCLNLTKIDEECIHAAGGVSTNIANLFWGCLGLKSLPSVLFMRDSSVYRISGLLRGTGITSVSSSLFKYLDLQDNTLDMVFMDTPSLTTVPKDIFEPFASRITTTASLFQNSALSEIPSGLLDSFTALTTVSAMFYGCVNLSAIPADLFTKTLALTTMSACFQGCTGIGEIPDDLFSMLSGLTSVNATFKSCSAISEIPDSLLANNVNLVQANELFYGTAITTIPVTLFAACSKLVYASSLVAACTSLTTIPDGLFANNPTLSVVNSTFDGCVALEAIPVDLFSYTQNLTNVGNCFRNVPLEFDIPGDFFPGTKLNNITGVFQNSGLRSIGSGLFKNHAKIVTMSYAFSNTKISRIPSQTFSVTGNTVQQAIAVFSDCGLLTTIDANAIELSSTVGNLTNGDYGSFLSNCVALTSIGIGAIRIEGRVASLVSFMNNCKGYRGSVTELLKQVVFDLSTPSTNKLDCSNMFNGVIWLTGSCMALWNAITNSATPNANRVRINFVEQCFLLTDYEAVGTPWWSTAISLLRASGGQLDVFTIDDVSKPVGHDTVPLFSTYYVNIPRDTLSNSFGALNNAPITGNISLWLSKVFLALGLRLPPDVETISLMSRAYGATGYPTAYVRPEVRLVMCLVFDRAITASDWNSTDAYLLCSLTT